MEIRSFETTLIRTLCEHFNKSIYKDRGGSVNNKENKQNLKSVVANKQVGDKDKFCLDSVVQAHRFLLDNSSHYDDEDEEPFDDEDDDYYWQDQVNGDDKVEVSLKRLDGKLEQLAINCSCKPVATKFDLAGVQVTDVDLVSHRDLCQLAYAGSGPQGQRHSLALDSSMTKDDSSETTSITTKSVGGRRCSLQEELGAYYRLCISADEQLIREKYLWFPWSLSSLRQVDLFFRDFPADKIPLVGGGAQASYRDNQISFQLPCQDLALNYCFYQVDQLARKNYLKFVKRRNQQALKVASVVEAQLMEKTEGCFRCRLRFVEGQLVVTIAGQRCFHPTCFTCSTCAEFLVDLVYCMRDQKLYCLRHYGESVRPRCAWCQELIFADDYLRAMDESYHVDHFRCAHCSAKLAGKRYVLREEKPHCLGCYETNFAHSCERCQTKIGVDSRDLSYKERHWHDACFQCHKCGQSLIDKPFGSKADQVYCADCYDCDFAAKCDGCKQPFRAGSKKMEYRGRQWHEHCFCCCLCQTPIGSNSFIPKDDEVYCLKCYEDKHATKCVKCCQMIVSGGVTFRNEPWHRDCFTCCHCKRSLAGQRFTTRDQTEEEETVKEKGDHGAYCIECYGELFAKKCFACSDPITGLNGTRFVTFEERSWHNDCFTCNQCKASLLGTGFITDGPHNILCADCARAKIR